MREHCPSFNVYQEQDGVQKDDEKGTSPPEKGELKHEESGNTSNNLGRTVTIGDSIDELDKSGSEFCFERLQMEYIKEEEPTVTETEEEVAAAAVVQPGSPKMYLATGLGLGGEGAGIDNELTFLNYEGNCDEDVEEYYKKLIEEHPVHPVLLKTYAMLLERKGDLHGAEHYYLRALDANPSDVEILARYAELVWILHHDQEKTLIYFERAAVAAPEDSIVLGAYASFLWQIEAEDSNDSRKQDFDPENSPNSSKTHIEGLGAGMAGLSVAATSFELDDKVNPEEFYKSMLEQNPSDSLLLKHYSRFLYQYKGDLQEAEKYYLRAIEADPNDGDILSGYA